MAETPRTTLAALLTVGNDVVEFAKIAGEALLGPPALGEAMARYTRPLVVAAQEAFWLSKNQRAEREISRINSMSCFAKSER